MTGRRAQTTLGSLSTQPLQIRETRPGYRERTGVHLLRPSNRLLPQYPSNYPWTRTPSLRHSGSKWTRTGRGRASHCLIPTSTSSMGVFTPRRRRPHLLCNGRMLQNGPSKGGMVPTSRFTNIRGLPLRRSASRTHLSTRQIETPTTCIETQPMSPRTPSPYLWVLHLTQLAGATLQLGDRPPWNQQNTACTAHSPSHHDNLGQSPSRRRPVRAGL
jgi:hypothetical protein